MKIRKKERIISLSVKDIKDNCNLSNAFTEEEVTYMCENRSLFKLEKGLRVEDEVINPNCYNFLGKREGKLCAFFYLIHSKILLNIELDRLEKYILQIKI